MSTPVAGRTASGDFKHIAVGDDGSLVVQSQALSALDSKTPSLVNGATPVTATARACLAVNNLLVIKRGRK